MYIENIAELAESVYFKVLQELSLDDLDSGFIKLDDDLNEFRNEQGSIVIIPENDWRYFKQIERV